MVWGQYGSGHRTNDVGVGDLSCGTTPVRDVGFAFTLGILADAGYERKMADVLHETM
jgi:hypothetical protein